MLSFQPMRIEQKRTCCCSNFGISFVSLTRNESGHYSPAAMESEIDSIARVRVALVSYEDISVRFLYLLYIFFATYVTAITP